jgi:hypothetical protein
MGRPRQRPRRLPAPGDWGLGVEPQYLEWLRTARSPMPLIVTKISGYRQALTWSRGLYACLPMTWADVAVWLDETSIDAS